MERDYKWHRLRAAHTVIFASALVLVAGQASAHVMPWRDGVSRLTGFGTCAKGPCLKRTDFSPSIPHVHLAVSGQDTVLVCTGVKRMPSACSTSVEHR